MPENVADAMTKVLSTLDEQGGRFALARSDERGWVAGLEFGREAPDSPMAAGAAYGTGDSALEAISRLAADLH